MDLLVILSVVVIMQTAVLARPADTNFKTKRSTDDARKTFKPSSFKFPAELRNGFTVTINGTLDTDSETFEVVFPSSSRQDDDNCRIIYDFKSKLLDMLPKHPAWNAVNYNLSSTDQRLEHPHFSIKLQAMTVGDKNFFKLNFEGHTGGDGAQMTCNLEKFGDFEGIEFKDGFHRITNFLFEIE